ncbi:MAG TPA: hypothetical protein VKU77_38880 [Streptosporangiaceae bacterium]|nr:hypothetical protein [Streptosporangiaceae bacterium]
MLTITAVGGGTADRGQLTVKITDARKLDAPPALTPRLEAHHNTR